MTDRVFEAGANFLVIATRPGNQVEKVHQGPFERSEEERLAALPGFLRVWRDSLNQYLAPGRSRDHNVITHRTVTFQALQSSLRGYHGWETAEVLEIPK